MRLKENINYNDKIKQLCGIGNVFEATKKLNVWSCKHIIIWKSLNKCFKIKKKCTKLIGSYLRKLINEKGFQNWVKCV